MKHTCTLYKRCPVLQEMIWMHVSSKMLFFLRFVPTIFFFLEKVLLILKTWKCHQQLLRLTNVFLSLLLSYLFIFFHLKLTVLYLDQQLHLKSKMSNKKKSVSSDIQTRKSELEKWGSAKFFLTSKTSVWISDEALFRMFDIASQSSDNSKRNSKQKLPNFIIIRITYQNLLSSG